MTAVNFTSALLEQVMVMTGSTDVQSGKGRKGDYFIKVGTSTFHGEDERQAFQKLFFWLLTARPAMTAEEYAERAAAVLQMEDNESAELLDMLSEGGMTDFGRQVEVYRQERGAKIVAAIKEFRAEAVVLPKDMHVLFDEITQRTGYDDLEMSEIVQALGDLHRIEQDLGIKEATG